MNENELKEQVKLLKEKLKKKNDKIKKLNKKVARLSNDHEEMYFDKIRYSRQYNAISTLLPNKYYKITYNVKCRMTHQIVSTHTELEIGRHPQQLIAEIDFKYKPRHYIQLTDILEVAS